MVCFQPYKYYHRQALDQAFRLGIYDFNQLDFIAALNEMHTKTFKQSIIISVFETTGLILYNFKKVLAPLCKKLENRVSNSALISTPSSTSSHTTTRSWPTPQNISDFREYVFNMHDILNSPCRRRFDRFATASLGRMIAGVEAEETLREHKKEAQERAKCQSDSRKIVA
jgi:hypothetical protein